MAAVADRARERRRGPRLPPEQTDWRDLAVLRPGQEVRVVNIGPLGALVESGSRLRPGHRVELHLTARSARVAITGRMERCEVARLAPLRYRGAIVFDRSVPMTGEEAANG
jgi:hypothetical protein